MDIAWEIITCVYMMADTLIKGWVYYYFARPFMLNKKGALWGGMVYSASMVIQYFSPFPIDNMIAYGLGVLAGFLVMCGMDRRNYCQKIFIATTFFSLRWLCTFMTSILTEAAKNRIEGILHISGRPALQLPAYASLWLLDLGIGFAIMGISVKCIEKAYVYKRENMSIKEMLMLCAPSIAGMTEYGILKNYQTFFEEYTGEIYSSSYRGLAFLHYGVSIISIVAMTVLFQNIKARQEDTLQKELLSVQIDSIRQHIEQVESLYQNIRGIRHDMTNHILTLESLYVAGETEAARAYSEDLKAAFAGVTGEISSGNPVTDVILLEMKNAAEKKNINFYSDFHYPESKKINAFDISIILNNGLQNAIEHAECRDTPRISVLSYRKNNAFMIEINNSFDGILQWDTENGLPVSSKNRKKGQNSEEIHDFKKSRDSGKSHGSEKSHGFEKNHGYGLSNIRRVAKKYAGDIDVMLKDGEFCLCILLMLE